MKTISSKNNLDNIIVWFLFWSFILYGVCSFCYQIIFWLKNGYWLDLSVLEILRKLNPKSGWVWVPDEWIGVQRFFKDLPSGLTAIFISPLFLLALDKDQSAETNSDF